MSTSITATIEGTGAKSADVVVRGNASGFLQEIVSGAHQLRADEPVDVGGGDTAPGPYNYLLAGLGACTSFLAKGGLGFPHSRQEPQRSTA